MAKFHGITGQKIGKLGNEIYYISKTQNLIRSNPAHIYNPRSKKQMIQRIKMRNTNNGYVNLIRLKKYPLFQDKKEVESEQNAYIRNNIDSACLVPKKLCRKKGIPIFSLNVTISKGHLNSPLSDNVRKDERLIGMTINTKNVEFGDISYKNLSLILMHLDERLNYGDKFIFFVYTVENISFNNQNGIIINNNEELRTLAIRKVFTLSADENRTIGEDGFVIDENDEDYPRLSFRMPEGIHSNALRYGYNGTTYMCVTKMLKPGTEEELVSASTMYYGKNYYNICLYLSNNKEYQEEILKGWETNFEYEV